MASLQTTYSGDLSQSIASNIWDTVGDAADDAHEERNRIETEIIAHNLKHPDRPFDPQFRKTYNVLGHEIKGGDFFGSALKHRFTPNPLGLLGKRFHKKDFVGTSHLKGQATPFASPVGPFPKPRAAWSAKMAGQPFSHVAAGADLKHQVKTGSNSVNPLTQAVKKPSVGNTTDKVKPVVVRDEKLGNFFAAIALSLNASLITITKKLDDVDTVVIEANNSIAGTHKRLEHDSDSIGTKLDQIIAALREQISMKKDEENRLEAKAAEDSLEDRRVGPEPNAIVNLDDNPDDIRRENEAEDQQQLSIPGVEGENPLSFKDGGSFIAKGPADGYTLPMELHNEEKVTVEPLDNKHTRGEESVLSGTNPVPKSNFIKKAIPERSTEIYNLTQQTIGKQIIENKDEDPDVRAEVKNLQKAIDVVQRLTGIFSIELFSKAAASMQPILGSAVEAAQTISYPITKLFGIPGVDRDIARDVGVQQATKERQRESKEHSEEKQQKNWFQKLVGFFGMGDGDRISRSVGGSTNYNRGGASVINQKTSMAKGGGGNALSNWYMRGYNPAEKTMSMRDLLKLDWGARQMTQGPGKGVWNPFRWLYTMSAEQGGLLSGPTPLIRELVRRMLIKAAASPQMLMRLAPLFLMEAIAPAPAGRGSTVFDEEGNLLHESLIDEHFNQSKVDFNSPNSSSIIASLVESGSKDIEEHYDISTEQNIEPQVIHMGNNQVGTQQLEHSSITNRNEPGYSKYFTSAYTA